MSIRDMAPAIQITPTWPDRATASVGTYACMKYRPRAHGYPGVLQQQPHYPFQRLLVYGSYAGISHELNRGRRHATRDGTESVGGTVYLALWCNLTLFASDGAVWCQWKDGKKRREWLKNRDGSPWPPNLCQSTHLSPQDNTLRSGGLGNVTCTKKMHSRRAWRDR
ncbi:hypothetical protein B0T17DRAFT_594266 [Bombardia bombarda]|uniref:Uncharacterized protein n=1 Tax=Bombardia bombarda TaxID=252184 RepID=A0AA39XI16_9PEZI|nr:hypothetical protein B0T17DRAFT_594266 [Bombardia bombarda]